MAIDQNWCDLSHFIAQTRLALRSVTNLTISDTYVPLCVRPPTRRPAQVLALVTMMLPVAHVCPQLFWLLLPLVWGPGLLRAMGFNSPLLNLHEELLVKVANGYLIAAEYSQLPTLFSSIARLSPRDQQQTPHRRPRSQMGSDTLTAHTLASATCTALNACPRLQIFSQDCAMSAEVWAALPCNVTCCTTGGICQLVPSSDSCPPPTWPLRASLLTLAIYASSVPLQGLSVILAASPSLILVMGFDEKLSVSSNWTADGPTDHLVGDLTRLNDRGQAGLEVIKALEIDIGGKIRCVYCRLILEFHFAENLVSSFIVAGLPPLPYLTRLAFYCHGVKIDMLQLSRVFPNLETLQLWDMHLDGVNLLHLGACKKLDMLMLTTCRGVSCAGVAALCVLSPMLRDVCCIGCKDMSAAEGQGMGREGWGGTVEVCVQQCGLDETWTN